MLSGTCRGIASEEQKNLIMDNLEHKIITPYGIPLMPGHFEKTHLARSVWTVYTTGYAVAAARTWKRRITCHFDRTADQKCCF